MKHPITFLVLVSIKIFGKLFYRIKVNWIGNSSQRFENLKAIILLNHTSLFEPIYIAALPVATLWKIAHWGVLPGADITLSRPVMGWFFKWVTPSTVPVSRRKDKTWSAFLDRVQPQSLVIIAPEGRMKRQTGLDKTGNPMTVRGGIADLLSKFHEGNFLIAYSGGLHHIMTPDEKLPKLFKKIRLTLETVSISDYKQQFQFDSDLRKARLAIAKDLESRRDAVCPGLEAELGHTTLTAPIPLDNQKQKVATNR